MCKLCGDVNRCCLLLFDSYPIINPVRLTREHLDIGAYEVATHSISWNGKVQLMWSASMRYASEKPAGYSSP